MRKLIWHIIFIFALCCTAAQAQVNTDQMLRVGQNALYFEDYVLSIQYFNQVLQDKPYMPAPYLYRAIAKLNLDDFAGAEADAAMAVKIHPYMPDAWEVRGVAAQNMGQDSAAVVYYGEALKLLPRNKNIMFNMAIALTDLKEHERADSVFEKIIEAYPSYDNAYIGRAKLQLQMADTTAASDCIDKALQLNPNAYNGYVLRASIAIDKHEDFASALADMDQAIKLQPRATGLYINRAYLRHELDDYFGAMADYDYALQLEPLNQAALFNRSLLAMEVSDYQRAVDDLTKILQINPNDMHSRYNRAVAYGSLKQYGPAIADITMVIEQEPELSSAYFMRSDLHRRDGALAKSEADYRKGMAVAKTKPTKSDGTPTEETFTPEDVANRFNALVTIDNSTDIDGEYNNQAIRGRVQDRSTEIEIAPIVELSYYSSPTELSANTYYIKEVDDINAARMLRYIIMAAINPPSMSETAMINRHFESIEYYNSYLSTHQPRAIDYIGRAMDFLTVRNYDAAIADIDRALELTPDQPVAYMIRAQAKYRNRPQDGQAVVPGAASLDPRQVQLKSALADLDRVVELSSRMAVAWYNKGNVLFDLGDYTSAIAAYGRAIELEPNMGQAYYNRGYVYLKLGNEAAGVADLSKAGELGIIPAYNVLKRIRN